MIFLDVEASGLAQASYPIEIAWLDPVSEQKDSFLINPFTCPKWDHWDHSAELIHGISMDQLIDEGISVEDAAERLTVELGGERVYTDCPAHDYQWVERLYRATGSRMSFRFLDVFDLVGQSEYHRLGSYLRQQKRPHRALADCYAIYAAVAKMPSHAFVNEVCVHLHQAASA